MQRDSISFYLNGVRNDVSGPQVFQTLSDFLRYKKQLTGTKVVCAEGDCGACTVMVEKSLRTNQKTVFESVNSCIAMIALFDGCHIVTVEGLQKKDQLSEVQSSMVRNFGAQCGFCTPGFVMALTDLYENKTNITEKHIKNYLTGNLCRCTGYSPIIKAGLDVDTAKHVKLKDRYNQHLKDNKFIEDTSKSLSISCGDFHFFAPKSLEEAISHFSNKNSLRLISGATDLGVQVNKRKAFIQGALSLQSISELYKIDIYDDKIQIGARATLSQVQNALEEELPEFSKFLNIFASPQIKNKATLAGNIANASPIADTSPALMALSSAVEVLGPNGSRTVLLDNFFKDYKKIDLKETEFIISIIIPKTSGFFKTYKVSQRRDLDISCVNLAINTELKKGKIQEIRIAVGGVSSTTLRLIELERSLIGKPTSSVIPFLKEQDLEKWVSPLDDVRGSKEFRLKVLKNLLLKYTRELIKEESGL